MDMRATRPIQILVIAVCAALSYTPEANAQSSKLRQAQEAIQAFERGDSEALADARAAINMAASHGKTVGSSTTWVVRGHIYLQSVLDPSLGGTSADPTSEVLSSFTRAGEIGLDDPSERRAVITDLRVLQSATQNEVFDRVERRQWDEAYGLVGRAMLARDLLISMHAADDRRDAGLLRLAVLITTHHGKLDEAKKHHRAYLKAGEFDPTITAQLTDKLQEAESTDTALLFVRKVREDRLEDPTLLTAEIDVLLAAERNDEAIEILDATAASLSEGVGSMLLLAKLFARTGADKRAETAFRRVLERDPEMLEALIPVARFALSAISTLDAQLDGARTDAEPTPAPLTRADRAALEGERDALYETTLPLLERAALATPDSAEILEMLHGVYQATGDEPNVTKTAQALKMLTPKTE